MPLPYPMNTRTGFVDNFDPRRLIACISEPKINARHECSNEGFCNLCLAGIVCAVPLPHTHTHVVPTVRIDEWRNSINMSYIEAMDYEAPAINFGFVTLKYQFESIQRCST